jgi:hypothetical protein
VDLTAVDQYQNVDTNYSASECIASSSDFNAPDGTGASCQIPASSPTGDSQVTFTAGFATDALTPSLPLYESQPVDLLATDVSIRLGHRPNLLELSLFDGEAATATLTTSARLDPEKSPSKSLRAYRIRSNRHNPEYLPQLSFGGGVGSTTCSSSGKPATSGNSLTASFQIEDQ